MDLTKPLNNEEEYQDALREYDAIFSLDDCCSIPAYGDQLYDRIKEYEEKYLKK